jgi:cobalt/nickel transport system permease protein
MSHIHLPDGVLPVWLWVSGFVVAILVGTVLFRLTKKEELTRRLPLLGMMAAVMVLGASVEIIPPVYHINLIVISGILLGPTLIFLATFVVNVILALFGHGGITVIGLNTIVLSLEGITGFYLFRLLWKVLKKLSIATFLATFLALVVSTFAMIGVVSLGTSHYEELMHHEKGTIGPEFGKEKETHHVQPGGETEINLNRWIKAIALPLFFGWILEGIITALMIKYIYRLRPDLLHLEKASP